MIQHINEITPLIGGLFIILIGGVVWAIKQIYSFLNSEFVKKIECHQCANKTKEEVLNDSNEKYRQVQKQFEENHREWTHEIKEIRAEAEKRNQTLVRIETKVDMLLEERKSKRNKKNV